MCQKGSKYSFKQKTKENQHKKWIQFIKSIFQPNSNVRFFEEKKEKGLDITLNGVFIKGTIYYFYGVFMNDESGHLAFVYFFKKEGLYYFLSKTAVDLKKDTRNDFTFQYNKNQIKN